MTDSVLAGALKALRRKAMSTLELSNQLGSTRPYFDTLLKNNERRHRLFKHNGKWYVAPTGTDTEYWLITCRAFLFTLSFYPNLPPEKALELLAQRCRDFVRWYEIRVEERDFGPTDLTK